MKLAIMQPYFLPYIGYFQAIYAVDKYILYENVSFIKKGWMNRNRILIKNGGDYVITAPLVSKSSKSFIHDIQLDNTKNWNTKILKLILYNYKGSKYFDEVYPLFEKILNKSTDYLCDWNAKAIICISEFIGLNTTIEYNNRDRYVKLEEQLSKVACSNYDDFRYMEKTHPSKKLARILAICENEGADTYINAIGGQDLYNKEEFATYGIDLKFVRTNEFSYSQFSKEFVPNLSIVDVLMHNGKVGTLELIKKYTLI